jgi:hypothetical protein
MPEPIVAEPLLGGSYMHTVPNVRKGFLSALIALAVLAGALFVATPQAHAGFETCPATKVCAYSGHEGTGTRVDIAGESSGCHFHSGVPFVLSIKNHTGNHNAYIPERGIVLSPGQIHNAGTAITGEICIA